MSMRYQAAILTASYFPLQTPDAPTIGTATASSGQVSTTFTAPTNVGGGSITSYIAVAKDSTSGAVFTNTGASSPIVVTGLTNGNTYTVTVAATNAYGTGPKSAASNSVSPVAVVSSVEYLVVAGGGGGGGGGNGNSGAGGGGAGGYLTATGYAVSAGSPITVTIGAGGVGGYNDNDTVQVFATNGSNSVWGSITATGGGRGSGEGAGGTTPGSGGSGGGASAGTRTAGTGTSGQGYRGGNASGTSEGGGGGGGAGAQGVDLVGGSQVGTAGGNGLQSSITGTATYYAGGGGGGNSSTASTGASGGLGGGGTGGGGGNGSNNGTSGTANTGGGGGGGKRANEPRYAGDGGSGVVIIRYADTYPAATSTTGSPTITVTGGYRIYKWTSSGSITF